MFGIADSMTSKKLPKVYKKWPKTDFTRKWKYLDTFIKLPKNLVKLIVATDLEKLPKVQ